MGHHVTLLQHVRLDHGLQHPSQGSLPRFNVRNVHAPRLRHLLMSSEPEPSMHFYRFPRRHQHLAEIGVFGKQKNFYWELLVRQEKELLRCENHSGGNLEDKVLSIGVALVDTADASHRKILETPCPRTPPTNHPLQACALCIVDVPRLPFPDGTMFPQLAASSHTTRPKSGK